MNYVDMNNDHTKPSKYISLDEVIRKLEQRKLHFIGIDTEIPQVMRQYQDMIYVYRYVPKKNMYENYMRYKV